MDPLGQERRQRAAQRQENNWTRKKGAMAGFGYGVPDFAGKVLSLEGGFKNAETQG